MTTSFCWVLASWGSWAGVVPPAAASSPGADSEPSGAGSAFVTSSTISSVWFVVTCAALISFRTPYLGLSGARVIMDGANSTPNHVFSGLDEQFRMLLKSSPLPRVLSRKCAKGALPEKRASIRETRA